MNKILYCRGVLLEYVLDFANILLQTPDSYNGSSSDLCRPSQAAAALQVLVKI